MTSKRKSGRVGRDGAGNDRTSQAGAVKSNNHGAGSKKSVARAVKSGKLFGWKRMALKAVKSSKVGHGGAGFKRKPELRSSEIEQNRSLTSWKGNNK